MSSNILDSAVVSCLPPVKSPPSRLTEIKRLRALDKAASSSSMLKTISSNTVVEDSKVSEQSFLLLHNDPDIRHKARMLCKQSDFTTYIVGSFRQLMLSLDLRRNLGVVVIDLSLDKTECEIELQELKNRYPNLSVIGLTSGDDVDWSAKLVNTGLLFLSLTKSLPLTQLEKAIQSGYKRHKMLNAISDLRYNSQIDESMLNPIKKIKYFFKRAG